MGNIIEPISHKKLYKCVRQAFCANLAEIENWWYHLLSPFNTPNGYDHGLPTHYKGVEALHEAHYALQMPLPLFYIHFYMCPVPCNMIKLSKEIARQRATPCF